MGDVVQCVALPGHPAATYCVLRAADERTIMGIDPDSDWVIQYE